MQDKTIFEHLRALSSDTWESHPSAPNYFSTRSSDIPHPQSHVKDYHSCYWPSTPWYQGCNQTYGAPFQGRAFGWSVHKSTHEYLNSERLVGTISLSLGRTLELGSREKRNFLAGKKWGRRRRRRGRERRRRERRERRKRVKKRRERRFKHRVKAHDMHRFNLGTSMWKWKSLCFSWYNNFIFMLRFALYHIIIWVWYG